jgi:hypothetical protein
LPDENFRASDIVPHDVEPEGGRVFSQGSGLPLEVFAREVQVRQLGAPGAFIGDRFGLLEGGEQLRDHPRVVPEDAVLDDDAVIRLEKSCFREYS